MIPLWNLDVYIYYAVIEKRNIWTSYLMRNGQFPSYPIKCCLCRLSVNMVIVSLRILFS